MATTARNNYSATYRNHFTFTLEAVRAHYTFRIMRGRNRTPYHGEEYFLGTHGMLEVMRRASRLYFANYNEPILHMLDRPKINRERFERAHNSLRADQRYPIHPMQFAIAAKYNQHKFSKVTNGYITFLVSLHQYCTQEAGVKHFTEKGILPIDVVCPWIYDACLLGRRYGFNPKWRTGDVVALCRGIYDEEAFDRFPVLADALQDAGCDSDELLGHLRSGAPATRASWVLSRVLGFERYN